jgi:C-terminal processing protease CtpA/Prc
MNLRKLLAGTALGLMLLSSSGPVANAMSTDQRLGDFGQLVNIIERNYGPLRWKQHSINLDFDRLVSDYRTKVTQAQSDAEFYRILSRFLSQLNDAHVSAMVPSTYRGKLGFLCDLVEGKVLIETIDRAKLPEMLFPFKKGDQLLQIDGRDVKDIMAELSQIGSTGHKESNDRIAAARLTSRSESVGLEVPTGVALITVLPKGAAQPVTVTATWLVSGNPVLELDDLSGVLNSNKVVNAIPTANDGDELKEGLKKLSMFNLALPQALLSDLQKAGVNDLGSAKSMFKLPEGAKEIPGLSVTAAVYEAAGKRIGILRIPSYTEDGLLDVLARAVNTMKDTTDVLVLDQTNNPGGSVALVSDIISLFADKSYKDMNFEIRPSLAWLKSFQDVNTKIADLLQKNPNDQAANALKGRFEYLESEMRTSIQNRSFSTRPISLNLTGTFGMIQPAGAVNYKKPILLLINEFDFSGGDAFPALMKDNGRVTTFGAQTSGAGGNVREYGPLANSFFKWSLTESLMVRPNGQYVENQGVKADVPYTVTEDDFMNGYRGYVKAFTIEALKLVGVSEADYNAWEAQKNAPGTVITHQ